MRRLVSLSFWVFSGSRRLTGFMGGDRRTSTGLSVFFPNRYTGFPFLDQPGSPSGSPGGKADGGFFSWTGYHAYILLILEPSIDSCLVKDSSCGIFPSKTPFTSHFYRKYLTFNSSSKLDAKSKPSLFPVVSIRDLSNAREGFGWC